VLVRGRERARVWEAPDDREILLDKAILEAIRPKGLMTFSASPPAFTIRRSVTLRSRHSTGDFNTALGAGALFPKTGDQNTATGTAALLGNITGNVNTANGEAALFFQHQR
jgi:hypothetical protein